MSSRESDPSSTASANPSNPEEVFINAIRCGATREQAAASAGIDLDALPSRDREKEIAQARARGFVDVLEQMRELRQSTALKLLLELCYANEMQQLKAKPVMTKAEIQTAFNSIMMQMTEEQIQRLPQLLELGLRADNQTSRNAPTPACQTSQKLSPSGSPSASPATTETTPHSPQSD